MKICPVRLYLFKKKVFEAMEVYQGGSFPFLSIQDEPTVCSRWNLSRRELSLVPEAGEFKLLKLLNLVSVP
ncbi:hypothetical protein Bca101_010239 [Brassica carinata]